MTESQSVVAPAMPRRIPWCTLLLCAATVALSVHAAIEISGTWLGRVRIVQLEDYGVRFEHLREFEFWRLGQSLFETFNYEAVMIISRRRG